MNKVVESTEETSKSYCVAIDLQAFLKLSRQGMEFDEALEKEMESLGAYDIDWNGHFGANIFFSLFRSDYGQLSLIEDVIKRRLEVL